MILISFREKTWAKAKQPIIGKIIDGMMTPIQKENSTPKGVLPKE